MSLLGFGGGNFPYVDSNNYPGQPKRPRGSTGVWPAVAGSASMATPPRAAQRPHVVSAHGDDRQDPWFWLRDRDDPEVLAYLQAENAYAEQEMAPLADLRSALFEEMKARIKETDMSVPARRGPWWYYSRTEEGKSYGIHCRRPCTAAARSSPLPASPGARSRSSSTRTCWPKAPSTSPWAAPR